MMQDPNEMVKECVNKLCTALVVAGMMMGRPDAGIGAIEPSEAERAWSRVYREVCR